MRNLNPVATAIYETRSKKMPEPKGKPLRALSTGIHARAQSGTIVRARIRVNKKAASQKPQQKASNSRHSYCAKLKQPGDAMRP